MTEQEDRSSAPTSSKREIAGQGLRYLLVGGSSALIELALFHLLHSVLTLAVAPSNITAIVVATACNFLLNRSLAFKSTSNPVRSLVLYLILFAVNMTFSTLVIGALEPMGVPATLAKLGTMCCIVIWNFVLYRKVIFK
ncbi:MAG: GtrA family protein [Coriobacteriales bacterium]